MRLVKENVSFFIIFLERLCAACRILFGCKHTVQHNLSDVEGESKGKGKRVQRTMWFCLGVSRVGLGERRLCQEHCSYLISLQTIPRARGIGKHATNHFYDHVCYMT